MKVIFFLPIVLSSGYFESLTKKNKATTWPKNEEINSNFIKNSDFKL